MVKGAGSGEVELFGRARRRGPWRFGGQSEVAEDPAHDDGVGELCDQAAVAAAMRAGQHVDGEDATEELDAVGELGARVP